jgi:hypothetical protein
VGSIRRSPLGAAQLLGVGDLLAARRAVGRKVRQQRAPDRLGRHVAGAQARHHLERQVPVGLRQPVVQQPGRRGCRPWPRA